MKLNMSVLDRFIRVLIVALIVVLYFTHIISGTVALILGIIAVLLLLTSIIGWCAIYALLGISTKTEPGGVQNKQEGAGA